MATRYRPGAPASTCNCAPQKVHDRIEPAPDVTGAPQRAQWISFTSMARAYPNPRGQNR
jgi:hypothetical protein